MDREGVGKASGDGRPEAVGGAFDERLAAWAYLSRVAEGPCSALVELIGREKPDPVAAAARVRAGDVNEELARRTKARRHHDCAQRDLETLRALGGRLVTPDSAEWPRDRFSRFGLGVIDGFDGAPPVALWALGRTPLDRLGAQAVAMVGTRAASGYGEHVAAEIAGDLASQGYLIVSGAAYGIDGTAHRAALGVGGETVAFLACGIDRAYPAGHARLLREVSERGLVVSEYPPGTVPARHRFLSRNRLVAGLADATVVVEAGYRSGAINTAGWADRMCRPLLAVPGPVTSAASAGCHALLMDQRAQIACSARDVAAVAAPVGSLPGMPEPERKRGRPTDDLTPVQLAVHGGLPSRGSATCGEIGVESGLPAASVMSALGMLESFGLARREADGRWSRVVPS